MKIPRIKRAFTVFLALSLILANIASVLPAEVFALDVEEMRIDEVRYIKNHNGYNVTGGNLIILGSNLQSKEIYFDVSGVPQKLGTLSSNSGSSVLNYELNQIEVNQFSGTIYAYSTGISLGTPNMPYISGANVLNVNQDQNESLTINGAKLNSIDNANYTATYGRGIARNNLVENPPPGSANSYTLSPRSPGQLGYQDIRLEHEDRGVDPRIKITYNYIGAFRILEDLNLDPIQMYPNSASRGDFIILSSDNFNSADKYRVYFLELGDNDFAFADYKMSPDVVLSQDNKRLSVQIPTSSKLELGGKKVIVTKIANDEIIARYNLSEQFNLIDAQYQPVITKINPDRGSDEGASIQIIGRNIIKPTIPGLTNPTGIVAVTNAQAQNSNERMHIEYDTSNLTFRGEVVSALSRNINVTISKPARFNLKEDGSVNFTQIGADDYLYVTTAVVDDVEGDPLKDVLVESSTTITTASGTFYFNQSAIEPDGFTFLQSSIEPQIDAVYPDLIQITPALKLKERTLISIEGDKFLVNKYTDSAGKLKTNYPTIQIQSGTQLGSNEYIAKFDIGDKSATQEGTIYNPRGDILKDTDGNPIGVSLVVLNKNGKVVDGSKGNEVGQRIVLYLPKELALPSGGRKNIQVINPKRESDDDGKALVGKDIVSFVQATDTPVIASVEPSIVTVNSNTEVVVKGSNFQEGVKLFIDGIEVKDTVREIDPQGSGMTLTFKSPKGRVGKTQLQVMNPQGGIAVRDFFFIKSFGQDPQLNSVSPNKGTIGTLVVAKGDNYFKPDPATKTAEGLDIYRLIGTRVFLDGKDVNDYQKNSLGDIVLVDYTAPSVEPLLKIKNPAAAYSDYKDNALVTNAAGSVVYQLTTDNLGNPQLFDGSRVKYVFKNKSGAIYAYKADGTEVGLVNISANSIQVAGGDSFAVNMDNKILGAKLDQNKRVYARLADYWNAVVMYDEANQDYYTLIRDLDGSIKLSNGKNEIYTIRATGSSVAAPAYKAFNKSGQSFAVSVTEQGISVDAPSVINLKMKTAFVIDAGRIVGKRARVYTKDEIHFDVPVLESGSGLKDVEVVNPDTKSAKLEKAFYYYHLPASRPIISQIVPNRGSVDGGYLVTIYGRDFKESTQVFFAGIPVPPKDKYVAPAGNEMEVKVPAYPVDLNVVYGVGELTVPVVVVNSDGASAQDAMGFTYVKPASTPRIKKVILDSGSSNGGEVVEIIGEDFRFFEPYINVGGGLGYDEGIDTFTNFNNHLPQTPKWDDLLLNRFDGTVDLWEPTNFATGVNYYGYTKYYNSNILPSVYFGNRKAKIVEFSRDYLKVISPVAKAGTVDVVVMNNDSGVSNKVPYRYTSSDPSITYINPSSGARVGFEKRDIVGRGFSKNRVDAYQNDNAASISEAVSDLDALVRFGDLGNEGTRIGDKNDGRINANHAIVNVEGGLRVSYDGSEGSLMVSLEEGGNVYSRKFTGYDGRDVLLPMGMLKKNANYYIPYGYDYNKPSTYNSETGYELVRVRVDKDEKRLFVSRGFAPKTFLRNEGKIELRTPSYYTIGEVNAYIYNPDGGVAKTSYTFTNPASRPIIESAKPMDLIAPNTVENDTNDEQRMLQASIQGGARIEIRGRDIRDGAKLYFGTKEVKILEIERDDVLKIQTIIAEVPKGTEAEISEKKPIIIINRDGGTAVSTDRKNLGTDKRLLYFIYRKPLSLPNIDKIIPESTSQYGGNIVEIRGSDFRKGSQVIIGSKGGVPVNPIEIDEFGRFLKFKMPSGLSPGKKDIQVVNSDFGTVTKSGGLNVISYPTIESKITDDGGVVQVNVVSTEGGDVITLRGSNFMKGAKVYFGGERKPLGYQNVNGVEGFYRDDKTYILYGAVPAKNVEYVNETTLKVTTPEINKEKEYKISVVNPDKGISPEEISIRFALPVPSASSSLKVSIVDKKYIKLYDYRTAGVSYYQIYVYLGEKTAYELRKNNYKDFKSLSTTSYEPYKISRLDGFTSLGKSEYAHFVVKGVNAYGSSNWSNIATLKYDEIKSVNNLGEGGSGPLIEPSFDEVARIERGGDSAKIVFTKQEFKGDVSATTGTGSTAGTRSVDVLFPKEMVDNYVGVLRLNTPLAYVTVYPYTFGNSKFDSYLTNNSGYANLKFSWSEDRNTSVAKSRLPSNMRAVSPVMNLSLLAKSGGLERDISPLRSPLKVGVKLYSPLVTEGKGSVYLYRYSYGSKKWIRQSSSVVSGLVKFDADSSGYYMLAQYR